jgi:hypothetical protein
VRFCQLLPLRVSQSPLDRPLAASCSVWRLVAPIHSQTFDTDPSKTLSYYFPDKTMWQSFVCAMTAAVVLQAFDPFRSGKLVLYQVHYSIGWHGFELLPYAILGVLGVSRLLPAAGI